MLKTTLVLINLTGLFLISLFTADISISDNTPSAMAPGESRLVEIQIRKGDVSGFAKLQIDLPAGLSASPVETMGASFTFAQGKAKFIWMTLPDQPEFIIRYNLKSDESSSGEKMIAATFSYIEDNSRVDFEMEKKSVMISGAVASTQPEVIEESLKALDEVADITNSVTEENISSSPVPGSVAINSETPVDEHCYREITQIGEGVYQVKVTVSGLDLSGYAKIQESVSENTQIQNKNASGAIVTIESGMIKYVWFQAPETDEFNVIYTMSSSEPTLSVQGGFYYVNNNEPTSIAIGTKGAIGSEMPAFSEEPIALAIEETVTPKPVAVPTVNTVQEPVETVAETIQEAEEVIEDPVVVQLEEIKPAQPAPKMSSVPAPETGVTYRVQIAAGHSTVGKAYFSAQHSFTENFIMENHEGWVKYTTGSHKEYKSARDDRERIRRSYNFNGPFVTAYNQGERITVQEALMITSQQWVQ